jgi:peptidoglycan hydrolase-like protein with peptidoglycan-binding domain
MNLPTFAAALAMGTIAWAGAPTSPTPTATPAKKAPIAPTVRKALATSAAAKTPVRSTSTASARRTVKKAPVVRASWRTRQSSPTADRYREIQQALVARGYLSQEDANGTWGTSSTEALKRFQAEQTLDSTGKIDSLSLIALGLGPKHDSLPSGVVDGNFQVESGRN